MIGLLRHLRWEPTLHRVVPPSPQERRVRRLLRIAARTHAKAAARLDRFNDEARELGAGEW